MFEQMERLLKIVCIGLLALLLVQFMRISRTKNILDEVKVPEIPTLATNTPTQTDTKTNVVATPEKKVAEAAPPKGPEKGTNATVSPTGTNVTVATATNPTLTNAAPTGTNVVAAKVADKGTNQTPTNQSVAASAPAPRPAPTMMPGGPGGAKKPNELPPGIQARVEKITKSEILAAVVRPLPMALFGIAGESAFLRAPNGQTGVIKEGEELGGIKLIKIGFNRVLVQQDGENKELMVFSGMGGESLLSKDKKELSK